MNHSLDCRIIEAMNSECIQSSLDILSGTPVFRGTRVPVQTLIDYLEGGDSIDVFPGDFPTGTRPQIIAVLESARAKLLSA